jgi:hypothetical protein
LKDLRKRPDLNGAIGVVKAFSLGRFVVRLRDGQSYRVLGKNLSRLDGRARDSLAQSKTSETHLDWIRAASVVLDRIESFTFHTESDERRLCEKLWALRSDVDSVVQAADNMTERSGAITSKLSEVVRSFEKLKKGALQKKWILGCGEVKNL